MAICEVVTRNRRRTQGLVIAAVIATAVMVPLHLEPSAAVHAARPEVAEESSCTVVHEFSADPVRLVGETATLQVRAGAICRSKPMTRDVVLVIDGSGSTSSRSGQELVNLAKAITRDLDKQIGVRVGVIEYDDSADVVCELTQSRSEVWACIDRIREAGSGHGNPVAGVVRGIEMLGPAIADPEFSEANLVLLSRTSPAGTCPSLVQAASSARSQGVLLLGACLGRGCDPVCFPRAFGRYDYSDRPTEIRSDLFGVIDHPAQVHPTHFTVTLTLPTALAPLADTLDPPGAVRFQTVELGSATGSGPNTQEFTATLQAMPRRPGVYPAAVESELSLRDNLGRTKTFPVESPSVVVLAAEEMDPMQRVYLPWSRR